MKRPMDTRQFERKSIRETVSISWLDREGNQKFYSTYSFDISSEGLSVYMTEPMQSGSYVNLRSGSLSLVGRAVVKNCFRRNGSYRIGLERVSEMKDYAPPVAR